MLNTRPHRLRSIGEKQRNVLRYPHRSRSPQFKAEKRYDSIEKGAQWLEYSRRPIIWTRRGLPKRLNNLESEILDLPNISDFIPIVEKRGVSYSWIIHFGRSIPSISRDYSARCVGFFKWRHFWHIARHAVRKHCHPLTHSLLVTQNIVKMTIFWNRSLMNMAQVWQSALPRHSVAVIFSSRVAYTIPFHAFHTVSGHSDARHRLSTGSVKDQPAKQSMITVA